MGVDVKKAAAYLQAVSDEWTGKVHSNGTPCHATVRACPKEHKAEGEEKKYTFYATVGGVNSSPEQMKTEAVSPQKAVSNFRHRGCNGNKRFIRNVWVKLTGVNNRKLLKNVIIDGDDDLQSPYLKGLGEAIRKAFETPEAGAGGSDGQQGRRTPDGSVGHSVDNESRGSGAHTQPIPRQSDNRAAGGVGNGGSAGSGTLTQGEFSFDSAIAQDAWVDSGTGNMAWKPNKANAPKRRPIDKLSRKTVNSLVAHNVKLIKTIPKAMFPEVATRIVSVLLGRMDAEDFVDWLVEDGGVSEGRAYVIAIDQIRKAKEQMKLLDWAQRGILYVEWRHRAGVNEPRHYHIAEWDGRSGKKNGKPNGLNGFVFRIDNPPVIDPKTGERGYPSDLIGCKCYLVPAKKQA